MRRPYAQYANGGCFTVALGIRLLRHKFDIRGLADRSFTHESRLEDQTGLRCPAWHAGQPVVSVPRSFRKQREQVCHMLSFDCPAVVLTFASPSVSTTFQILYPSSLSPFNRNPSILLGFSCRNLDDVSGENRTHSGSPSFHHRRRIFLSCESSGQSRGQASILP